jgi:actin-related protein
MKKQFLSSILFVGGLSNMKGFLSRVREELEFLLDDYFDGKYSALKGHIGFYTNPEPSSTKFCSAWIGGKSFILAFIYIVFSQLNQSS